MVLQKYQMLLQSVTKVSNVVTKCYKVISSVIKLSNCYKGVKCCDKVFTKYYKGVKCCDKVLQSVTKDSNKC